MVRMYVAHSVLRVVQSLPNRYWAVPSMVRFWRRTALTKASMAASVNASRKLTPCGSGKIDPGGVGSVAVGAVFLGQQLAALAGAVGVTGEGEDLGVVDQPVDHRCGHDVVGEGLTPAPEGQVRGDHD